MRLVDAPPGGSSPRQHGWGFRAEVALPLCNAAAG